MARFSGSGKKGFTSHNVTVDGRIEAESDSCKFDVYLGVICLYKLLLWSFV